MVDHFKKGYIQIYTGNGKGKSTACFGLALRAAGQGFCVRIIQFMKTGEYGENRALNALQQTFPNLTIEAFGRQGFLDRANLQEEDIALAQKGLALANHYLKDDETDILILDEINNALYFNVLTSDEILSLLDRKPPQLEIVLSGRNAPIALLERADYVTEMREIKHPFTTSASPARRGIEF